MTPSFRGLVIALLSIAIVLPCDVRAEGPTSPPPMAEPVKVTVIKGGQVEIPLRASGRTPGQLRFLTRSDPHHGTLGEIRPTSGKTAVVTYRHTDAQIAGFDRFRYAVQAVDSPVSASAEVQISVIDPPAELSAPRVVAFGETALGSRTRRLVKLHNTGGQSTKIHLQAESPWQILSEHNVEIDSGASQDVTLEFLPLRPGRFESVLVISEFPDTSIRLTGMGVEVLAITPEEPLIATGESREFPEVEIRNLTSSEQNVEFLVPESLSPIEPVLLPGEGSVTIRPVLAEGWLGPVSGELVVRSGEVTFTRPVFAEASPPKLTFPTGSEIDFGKVTVGVRTEQNIEVRNLGGAEARLDARVPEGLVVIPPPSTIVLPPGASKIFSVALETSKEGPFRGEIVLSSGEGSPLVLGVRALVKKSPQQTSVETIPTKELIPLEPTGAQNSDLAPEDQSEPWIPEGGFQLLSQSPGTVEIGWSEEEPLPERYLVEYRSIHFAGDDLPPKIQWHTLPEVLLRRVDGTMTVRILRLPPDSTWSIRLVPVTADGIRQHPSATLKISSPPLPSVPWFVWLLPAAALLAAGFFLFKKIRRSREEADAAERGRISRLEKGM